MKNHFTSASTFPVKLFHNPIIQQGKIVPYHITMIPTNVCNADCRECFCDKRDKTKVMSYEEAKRIINMLQEEGTRAISLSGGGEPDCHPQINGIINYIHDKGIDVALVTNGINLHTITDDVLNKLQWIRVSGTTSRPINLEKLAIDCKRGDEVDWGLSYVIGSTDDSRSMEDMIKFSQDYSITHIRAVSNMREPEYNHLPKVRFLTKQKGLDDSKVVWNERVNNEQGRKDCRVPLLHPVIDVDGYIQPCCGIHFAITPEHDFGKKTALCHWTEYPKLLEEQKTYDGRECKICQYAEYNKGLDILQEKPVHRRFI